MDAKILEPFWGIGHCCPGRVGRTNGRKFDIPFSLERGSVDRGWLGNEPFRI